MAPGWIHQLSPILQKGIISAILPMVCDYPHGIMIDIVTEGGASGSPIFNVETGEVIAMLYGGLFDTHILKNRMDEDNLLQYRNTTSHTLAIPCWRLHSIFKLIDTLP